MGLWLRLQIKNKKIPIKLQSARDAFVFEGSVQTDNCFLRVLSFFLT